jgi:hypothetical protein
MALIEAPYAFDVFGLKVHSYFNLPEIKPSMTGTEYAENSVTVSAGSVPEELEGGRRVTYYMAFSKDTCLYTFEGVARILIKNGSEIIVDLHKDGNENDMRAYLVGSGLGTLLHQRKMLPLHISAVETPSGIVAFTGHSGAGKSTIAALLHRKTGWPLISDDLAVLDLKDVRPTLHTGVVRIKLWKDAIAMFQPSANATSRDFARLDKFHVHEPASFSVKKGELAHLILLERGEDMELTPLTGANGFKAIVNSIYRPELVDPFNDSVAVFKKCADTARCVNTYSLTRPWSKEGLMKSIDSLAERFAKA